MCPLLAATLEPAPTGERSGPREFASGRSLTRPELLAAPVRWPRPSRLQAPLEVASGKVEEGLRTLGLTSVGALLEHLPRDSRDARTVSQLVRGESATVAVEVREIAVRPLRRRAMKPLVEAAVFDETGTMRARFFNQPWLAQRYRPGTRLVLHGKLAAGGAFNVAHHAIGSDIGRTVQEAEGGAPARVAHYPATDGVSSTQILTLVRAVEPAPRGHPRDARGEGQGGRGTARSRRGARGDALSRQRSRARACPPQARVRGAAC